jgi:hypothetical protein
MSPESAREPAGSHAMPASTPAPAAPLPWVAAGHDVLFGEEMSNRCDVCGEIVDDDAEEGPAMSGRALYVWARGDVIRREEPPLCPPCAAALGLSALGRWEIEEEEG